MVSIATPIQRLKLGKFARDKKGSAVVFVATSIFVLVAAAGLAFDAGRGYLIKARLSQAVDSAALAGGRSLTIGGGGDYEAQINKYFVANFPNGFMGATVVGPTIKPSPDGASIEVTATANIPTTLMRVLKVDGVQVSARSVVTRALRGLEVALVLDHSGSMNQDGKLTDLKTAADILLDTMYGDNEVVEDLYLSVVPFAGRTNLRAQVKVHPNNPPDTDLVCLNERPTPHDIDDSPPATNGNGQFKHYDGSKKTNVCPNAALQPLAQSKSAVRNAVQAMSPSFINCTRYDVGTVWGWRTLSPKWRGYWQGNAALPLDYDEEGMDKAIIIMTDGENSPDVCGDDGKKNKKKTEDLFEQMCVDMKAAGIIVYTITFKLDSAEVDEKFANCASGDARYFKSPNADELEAAFTQIANDLTTLRLAQ